MLLEGGAGERGATEPQSYRAALLKNEGMESGGERRAAPVKAR